MESFPFAKRRGDEDVQKKRKKMFETGEIGKAYETSRVDWAF